MRDYAEISLKLQNFLKDYVLQSGSKGFVLGVSGGIDSAVVGVICKLTNLPTNALIMPTSSSSKSNLEDAFKFCKDFDIDYKIFQIQPILDSFNGCIDEKLSNLRYGNLAARVRMCLLYDYSASLNSLVVGTSNKSERMLGYGTIYGDMACALNPIGELFKSEIFEFAKFLGIDERIIKKAPSADLWYGQSDESELGFSYLRIDEVLKAIQDNEDLGSFDKNLVLMIQNRMKANVFKLNLPPIAKID